MNLAEQILDLSGFTNLPLRLLRDYLGLVLESSPVHVRSLRRDDYEAAKQVEAEAWGEKMPQFDRDQFEARVAKFPKGNVAAFWEGRMVGIINTQRTNYDFDRPIPTWYEATNNGFLRHEPDGAYLYGVNLSIAKNALLSGAGNVMMLHVGKVMLDLGLKGILLGVRPLRYHRFAARMSFDEYLYGPDGEVRDPELGMYCRMGFHVKAVLPNYFDDPESGNFGVLLLMDNPHAR
ncbi:MAG: hypothetical protein HY000_10020 [Planctomycetes bacterium]|nr:hypothetical protein [Planctomycetota bacterium]